MAGKGKARQGPASACMAREGRGGPGREGKGRAGKGRQGQGRQGHGRLGKDNTNTTKQDNINDKANDRKFKDWTV